MRGRGVGVRVQGGGVFGWARGGSAAHPADPTRHNRGGANEHLEVFQAELEEFY